MRETDFLPLHIPGTSFYYSGPQKFDIFVIGNVIIKNLYGFVSECTNF